MYDKLISIANRICGQGRYEFRENDCMFYDNVAKVPIRIKEFKEFINDLIYNLVTVNFNVGDDIDVAIIEIDLKNKSAKIHLE